jgi:hypothetical protein
LALLIFMSHLNILDGLDDRPEEDPATPRRCLKLLLKAKKSNPLRGIAESRRPVDIQGVKVARHQRQ